MLQRMRDAAIDALDSLAEENRNLVVLDADVSRSTGSVRFAQRHPDQFIEVGITEQNMMAVAAGLASTGKIPFVVGFAAFAVTRAADQIRVSVAYPNLNVKIIGTHAGLDVGPDGPTHQAIEDIGITRSIPNIRVLSPADAVETQELVKYAAATYGPRYIRLPRSATPLIPGLVDATWSPRKATVLRKGHDVVLVATGVMVHRAMSAAEALSTSGISAGLLSVHSIKPLDTETIVEMARNARGLVVIEDHNVVGGLGSAVTEAISEALPKRIIRLGVRDKFAESAEAEDLFDAYGLGVSDIVRAAEMLMEDDGQGAVIRN